MSWLSESYRTYRHLGLVNSAPVGAAAESSVERRHWSRRRHRLWDPPTCRQLFCWRQRKASLRCLCQAVVSRSSGLAKTILQGMVKGGRRQGRQRKRWEDNVREWTGLEFAKSQRALENREKRKEETGCEVTCGAPTPLAVKG